MFVEVKGEKLVGRLFHPSRPHIPPSLIGLKQLQS